MRILLMRHGQTDLNIQKRLQGSSEIPLNERGRQQARETRALVERLDICPTVLLSSPLGRAIETGCVVAGIPIEEYEPGSIRADHCPQDVEIVEDLVEMAFGIYEQRNMTEENPRFLESCFDRPATYEPPEGGEDYDAVVTRAGQVVELLRSRIKSGVYPEDTILLMVSHGALSHGMFEYLKKTPRSAYWDVDFNNCAIAELFLSEDGSGDDYRFLSDGFEKNW